MWLRVRSIRLLSNTGFILILAFASGLLVPDAAQATGSLITPLLALVMTFSMLGISADAFTHLRRLFGPVAVSLSLNYIVLGGTFVGLAWLLVSDPDIRAGYMLLAAVPPAIAITPYSYRLGGNTTFAVVGGAAAYLAALVFTPLACLLLLGTSVIGPMNLVTTLVQLIVAPALVSRILRRASFFHFLERHRGKVVNWSFFVVSYTIVGLNRSVFFGDPDTLLRASVVAFATTFVLGEVIDRVARWAGADRADRISFALFGTRKNNGLAAGLALAFFTTTAAAVPAAILTPFAIAHFLWLDHRSKPGP